MIYITIRSWGKVKKDFILKGESEYVKRLTPYAKVHFEEITKSEDRYLNDIDTLDSIWLLDEKGVELTSVSLSKEIKKVKEGGTKKLFILIGPPDGFSEEIKKRVKIKFSLSKLTFPFEFVRLIIAEQLYRGISILEQHPYHRG